MAEISKTGTCNSCGNDKVVYAVPSSQPNNPKLFWFCDVCKFAYEKEKRVQALLRGLAQKDAEAADDPQVVSQLHEQVAAQILTENAEAEKLAPNEQFLDAVPAPATPTETAPEVVEAEPVAEAQPVQEAQVVEQAGIDEATEEQAPEPTPAE